MSTSTPPSGPQPISISRGALESYRRSQYLVAGASVSSSVSAHVAADDEEAQSQKGSPFFDIEEDREIRDDVITGNLRDITTPITSPHENTPLLGRISSPESFLSTYLFPQSDGSPPPLEDPLSPSLPHRRRTSDASMRSSKSVRPSHNGQSTFGQTLFNSTAMLVGLGMLSEPLAFAYAGWIIGTLLIFSYAFVACYTAKILARLILADPRIRSYSDIGRKAFGARATPIISFLFCLELFSVSVVLVTLFGDSLHTLMPQYSSNFYKAWGTIILIPMVFLPLSLLSYTSILGILSTITLVIVIFIDGLSKKEGPGSLFDPQPTNLGTQGVVPLGVAFGLFMAGFSGHAVIPSLARDMIDPTQFDTMVNWSFIIATSVYTVIGYVGYLMFGNNVSDEVSIDLLSTPGYNPGLNTLCLWLLVVTPFSKFGLNTQPLNATIEILLGLDSPITSPEDLAAQPDRLSGTMPKYSNLLHRKRLLGVLQRIVITSLSVTASISIPDFSSMMAFLGSFSAFTICIIGPILAKVMIEGNCSRFDVVVLFVGSIMVIWGTIAAFI